MIASSSSGRLFTAVALVGAVLVGHVRAGEGDPAPPADSAVNGTTAPATPAAARLDSVVQLPEVVVERDRAGAARRRRPTAFVTELRVDDALRGGASVADVLRRAAGVHVVRQGGLGAFSTVSLRGAPAGQVAVYVDGMPLQSAAHSVVNLAEIPASQVRTVEIYRGGAPLELGPGRPGGAIHFTTGARGGASLRVTRGSFATWDAAGDASGTFGALRGSVHGGYQGSDGDYPYLNDNGTPLNSADDVEARRLNNRFDMAHGGARLAWLPGPRWRLQVAAQLQRQGQGFPGLGSVPAPNARSSLARGSGQLSAVRLVGADGRIEAAAMLQRDRRRFADAEGRLGLGRHRTDDRFATEQVAARAVLPTHLDVQLEGGVSMRLERATVADALDGRPDPPSSARRTRSAEAGVRWQPLSGPLLLVAAERRDRIDDRLRVASGPVPAADAGRETRSPQLGARLALAGGVELRANWSRAERVPDFLEFFGDQGGVSGNSALRPERVESRDAGLAWSGLLPRGMRGSVEWTRFSSSGDDFIVFTRHSQTAVKAENIARAEIRGEEFALSLDLPHGFAVSGVSTWQSALDDGDVPFWRGRRLPQRPARESFAHLKWNGYGLDASLETHFIGDSYRDRANRSRVPGRTLVDAVLGWSPWGPRLRLAIEGRNLGDRRASDVTGYPLPGRSILATIQWRAAGDAAAN